MPNIQIEVLQKQLQERPARAHELIAVAFHSGVAQGRLDKEREVLEGFRLIGLKEAALFDGE